MILNTIEKYNFKCNKKNHIISNFIKKKIKMHGRLTSIFSFVNKSFIISTFSFSIAAYNGVL